METKEKHIEGQGGAPIVARRRQLFRRCSQSPCPALHQSPSLLISQFDSRFAGPPARRQLCESAISEMAYFCGAIQQYRSRSSPKHAHYHARMLPDTISRGEACRTESRPLAIKSHRKPVHAVFTMRSFTPLPRTPMHDPGNATSTQV